MQSKGKGREEHLLFCWFDGFKNVFLKKKFFKSFHTNTKEIIKLNKEYLNKIISLYIFTKLKLNSLISFFI